MTKTRDLANLADLNFDSGTMVVDKVNDRVGVGNATPSATLDVDGTIKLDGNYPVGTNNVALGDGALDDGSLSGDYNTALGSSALTSNTSGGLNVAIGTSSGFANTTGSSNTSVGFQSLVSNTTASNNTAVGYQAGYSATTGGSNSYVGQGAGYTGTTSYYNVAMGNSALYYTTTGASNVAIGVSALQNNTTASENTAVGYTAMQLNTTGTGNVSLGGYALRSNTTANYNTAIGYQASKDNTTGTSNVAVGTNSQVFNTTGGYNTSVGMAALQSNTTASNNTAVGYQAGYSNTTGFIDAFGFGSLDANTTGNFNVAFGTTSLTSNTTGNSNSAFGRDALYSNTTGSFNIAVGTNALLFNTTAGYNTALGYEAGYSNTTGIGNTFIGLQAGFYTTGNYNTFIGPSGPNGASGALVTTGSKNTILGSYSGNQGGVDIRTASNNIVLSDGDGTPRIRIDSNSNIHRYYPSINQSRTDFTATNFGYSGGYTVLMLGQSSGNHTVSIGYNPIGNTTGGFTGNGSETLFRRGMKFLTPNISNNSFYVQFTMTDGVTSGDFNDTSDVALKENIQTILSAWNTVSQLRPVTFDWKQEGRGTRSGFIAQEVEALLPHDVMGDDYVEPDPENGIEGSSGKAINTTGIVAHLTKALQEAMDRIETLEAKVQALETN